MKRPEGNYLEIRAGLFVLIGVAVLVYLAVQFGGLTMGAKKTYPVTVEFPNAAGLLKDSDVLLAGAKIGRVARAPEITLQPKTLQHGPAVKVELALFDGIQIPRQSRFIVGSAGLLGDRFVDVIPNANYDPKDFVEANAVVPGSREFGIEDLAVEGGALVEDLRGAVAKVSNAMDKLDKELLGKETIENFNSSLKNLKTTTESFARTSSKVESASGKLEEVMSDVDTAVGKGGKAMETTEQAAADLRLAINDARTMLNRITLLVEKSMAGDGVLPSLLNDDQLSTDLKALIADLRRHGVLFYKDRNAPQETPRSGPAPSPPRGRPGRP